MPLIPSAARVLLLAAVRIVDTVASRHILRIHPSSKSLNLSRVGSVVETRVDKNRTPAPTIPRLIKMIVLFKVIGLLWSNFLA